jgi:hypothetical protein
MRRRGGRPGLIGTMARTAVITGTATATMGMVGRSKAQPQAGGAQPVAPVQAPEPPPVGLGADTIAKLKDLGELRTAGVLTDQEFAQAKAKLLG